MRLVRVGVVKKRQERSRIELLVQGLETAKTAKPQVHRCNIKDQIIGYKF